jgi:hypothetical protein
MAGCGYSAAGYGGVVFLPEVQESGERQDEDGAIQGLFGQWFGG